MASITLFKKDKKGNVLSWKIELNGWNHFCNINVFYGRFGGKQQQEQTAVKSGKANRTIKQQAELQYNSLVSKQKDKGYKSLEDLHHLLIGHEEGDSVHGNKLNNKTYPSMEEFLKAELPSDNTDANGNPKPMKCTALQDTKTNGLKESVLKKIQYPALVQPKLDGVRCIILYDENQSKWIALSSSGKSYDVAVRHILDQISGSQLPKNIILDGEIYIHGESLEYLSGLARKQTPIEEQLSLEYYVFDLIYNSLSFEDRNKELVSLYLTYLDLTYLRKVPTHNADKFEGVSIIFNNYIEQGFEGVIIRNVKGMYKQGVRSSEIFKWKAFQDSEYEIIGIELGKRGSEDMVFVLKTIEGKEFKAKPLGNRRRKDDYVQKLSSLKGKMATIQYLTLSEGNIPQGNPRLKTIRDYE